MTTLPNYPAAVTPLAGSELVPIWQDGAQRSATANQVLGLGLALMQEYVGATVQLSWAALSAVAGTRDGQVGVVPTQTGEHVDPVSGDTVPNTGFYRWVEDYSAWQWVTDTQAGAALALLAGVPRSGTIAEREAIPLDQRKRGLRFLVTSIVPWRVFEWRVAGDTDSDGGLVTTTDWVGLMTQTELLTRGNHRGTQAISTIVGLQDALDAANDLSSKSINQNQVNGLPGSLDAIRGAIDTANGHLEDILAEQPVQNAAIDVLASIQIADFRVVALSSNVNPTVQASWALNVPATRLVYSWDGTAITLPGTARTFTPKDWETPTALFIYGDSQADENDIDKWPKFVAALLGLNPVDDVHNVARYSGDARQPYRGGVTPILLTFASNQLLAGGTASSVTGINGVSPVDISQPSAFLSPGDAGVVTGMSMPGIIIDGATVRHGIASAPNGASNAYKFTQDAGLGALTLSGQVQFVPDIARYRTRSWNLVDVGANMFNSGVPGGFGDYTNPFFWTTVLDPIVAAADGNRTLLIEILPSTDFTTTGVGNAYDSMLAANARTDTRYPGLRLARSANGRTLLKYLQDACNPAYPGNTDDIAAGMVPREYRYDALHLNDAGNHVKAQFVFEALQAQTMPAAITQDTVFTLTAYAVNPRTAEELGPVVAVSGVTVAPAAFLPAITSDEEPSVTSAALWFKTTPGSTIATLWIKGAS
jgi:hypothetical protein